ncbi:MarR family winged helix-turn-helix transcriptional regulator [Aquibium sp. LZ166]|uniref:MarR family winged helix-turn-helix transcriptional regulator n=1 Tax=Aquibium pacificus TaxID=3153579 RepID=A0ABV3SGW0_9HYPH
MPKSEKPDEEAASTWVAPPGIGLGNLFQEGQLAFVKVFRTELAAYGVTVSQYQHLRKLWEQDGITQAQLSKRVGIESASSTATLNALERRGLISRIRDSADLRKVKVYLTPAGRMVQDDLIACARRTNEVATAGMSKGEIDIVFSLVGKITRRLRGFESADQPASPSAAAE